MLKLIFKRSALFVVTSDSHKQYPEAGEKDVPLSLGNCGLYAQIKTRSFIVHETHRLALPRSNPTVHSVVCIICPDSIVQPELY